MGVSFKGFATLQRVRVEAIPHPIKLPNPISRATATVQDPSFVRLSWDTPTDGATVQYSRDQTTWVSLGRSPTVIVDGRRGTSLIYFRGIDAEGVVGPVTSAAFFR